MQVRYLAGLKKKKPGQLSAIRHLSTFENVVLNPSVFLIPLCEIEMGVVRINDLEVGEVL